MGSAILFWTYLAVMFAAAVCFAQAYRVRKDTPRHKRFGIAGVLLALGGILVVLALTYVMGWRVPHRFTEVVLWHRRVAYVSTALLLLTAWSGMQRWPRHPLIARVSVAVYLVALALACVGYRP
ncbi:MAG: hypothetical protein AB7T63_00780 [Planctomycetota bacterium]